MKLGTAKTFARVNKGIGWRYEW